MDKEVVQDLDLNLLPSTLQARVLANIIMEKGRHTYTHKVAGFPVQNKISPSPQKQTKMKMTINFCYNNY